MTRYDGAKEELIALLTYAMWAVVTSGLEVTTLTWVGLQAVGMIVYTCYVWQVGHEVYWTERARMARRTR